MTRWSEGRSSDCASATPGVDRDERHENRGDQRPDDLEPCVPVDRAPVVHVPGRRPELVDRVGRHTGDEREDDDADDRDDPVDRVDDPRLLRSGVRQPGNEHRDDRQGSADGHPDQRHLDDRALSHVASRVSRPWRTLTQPYPCLRLDRSPSEPRRRDIEHGYRRKHLPRCRRRDSRVRRDGRRPGHRHRNRRLDPDDRGHRGLPALARSSGRRGAASGPGGARPIVHQDPYNRPPY